MSIHRRLTKNGTVFDVRYREGGKNRGRTFDTREDAKGFEAEQTRRRRLGAHAPAEASTTLLTDFLEHWMLTSGPTWAAKTQLTRIGYVEKWIDPYLGSVPLRDLGRARVREWRAEIMRDGSRPVNTNNIVRVLSSALGTAADEGMIPANPCLRLGRVPTEPTERKAWPPAAVNEIINAMPTQRDRAIVAIMAYAGLRPAEVVALRWEDVRSGTIHVWRSVQVGSVKTAKGFASRTVPISPKLRKVLDAARPDGAEPGDLIAQAQRGEWLNWSMWGRKVWQPVRDSLGLTGVPYDLRHTAASTWIMDGHDLLTVASWLGHAPAVTLDHYAHLFAEARTERASTSTAPKRARRPSARPASSPETRARGRSSARGTAARS